MGKFTDDFFSFPIKVYDGFSLKKAMEREERDNTDEPVPIDWVVGWVKIPGRDLGKLMWHDGFSRERRVEDVAKEGFDTTIVVSDIYGDFVCTWPRKKFEQKLDEFMEKRQTTHFTPFGSVTPLNIDELAKFNLSSSEGTGKKPE